MKRYRSPITSSHKTIQFFRNIAKVGRLVSIKGYRYSTNIKGSDGPLRLTGCERVMVRGEHGTARFGGVCWGYGGEGPHALRDLFIACGLSQEQAEQFAFNLYRDEKNGVDWEIVLPPYWPVVKLVKGYCGN